MASDRDERPQPSAITPEARVGQTLNGKWRVDRLLDVGGMGAVYAATHRNGCRSALKVLHPQFARNVEVRGRFQREGYVANKIGHPGAVAILDDGVAEDGSPYLVMELLDGESLAAWLARAGGRIPMADALAIAGQVLAVLASAHQAAIVHRDIKPANIFVTRGGHAKLLDFGLARVRDASFALLPTGPGTVLGTPGFMSPEQARGKSDDVDGRADIFSVGAVIFNALTGRRIHEHASGLEAVLAAMRQPAPPLASCLPGASALLTAAVDKALAFDKTARWATAHDMLDSLRLAYDESCARGVSVPVVGHADASERAVDSSLVIDVVFGDHHDEALALERQRTREVAESISSVHLVLDGDP